VNSSVGERKDVSGGFANSWRNHEASQDLGRGATKILDLDLETRSRCDLSKCGAWRYSEDPSTEVLCLQGKLDGVWITRRYGNGGPYPIPDEIAAARPSLWVVAHNCEFEQAHWRNVLRWPEPAGWVDTMALAAANALPQSLDGCAAALGLGNKDSAGATIMRRLCKPDRKGEFPHISEDDWTALLAYCKHDVELEAGILEALGRLPLMERKVWRAHNAINGRGIPIDLELCQKAIRLWSRIVADAGKRAEAATGGAVKAADLTRVAFLLDWAESRGVELKDFTAGTIAHALRRKNLPDDVRTVLECRQRISRSSTTKLETMLDAAGSDGRVRGCFNYHGALTGRWAGRLIQPQNLPKSAKGVNPKAAVEAILAEDATALAAAGAGDPEDAIVAAVRAAIYPGPGKVLAVVDYAAIEARGALWLAEDEKHLDAFRRNEDLYCAMASRIFGRPISKADKMERQVGKAAILGCGYGMGAERFDQLCKSQDIELASAGVTAEGVIAAYREEFASLALKKAPEGERAGLWNRLTWAAVRTVQTGRAVMVGKHLQFRLDSSDNLRLRLPSGRELTYRNPRIEEEEREWQGRKYIAEAVVFDSLTHGKSVTPERAWGGLWLENACQATCRDLLADALVRLEDAGAAVVLQCHDEIVCEADAADGDPLLERMEHIMTNPPSWAAGFPVAVEGFLTTRYGKDSF
jgi:DNA polymerase